MGYAYPCVSLSYLAPRRPNSGTADAPVQRAWIYRTRARCRAGNGPVEPFRLQPALVAEEPDHAHERGHEQPEDDPEGRMRALAGEEHVHPEHARDQRQRQHRHADEREETEDVVLAVRDHRLVRLLQRVGDLLVV